jgi:hypothetical protein
MISAKAPIGGLINLLQEVDHESTETTNQGTSPPISGATAKRATSAAIDQGNQASIGLGHAGNRSFPRGSRPCGALYVTRMRRRATRRQNGIRRLLRLSSEHKDVLTRMK